MSTRLTDLTAFSDSSINDLDYYWTDEYQEATVTMTIASPSVITWTAHGLLANTPVIFATSGALPTGFVAGTTYYVISTGLTANEFQLSATQGGTAINTSGSQSGVHTGKSYISKKISGQKIKSILGNVSYANTFTPGSVTVANTITHNLATEDIIVQLWDITADEVIYAQIDNKTTNTVDVTFDENPAGDVRVIVLAKGGAQVETRPYTTLTATFEQTGVIAPTFVRVNENTLGFTPTWSRISAGRYRLTSTGNFPTDGSCNVFFGLGVGTLGTTIGYTINVNYIDVWVDFNGTPNDGLIANSSIKIEIY